MTPRYEQGYEQDLIGATARVRDGEEPHRYGVIEDEIVDKVKIRWPFGGSDWVHKRDIVVLG
jgi:hypothetical protein